ncbi:MFS multidrug transporter [Ramaria rubella]|nr:MFS multidrug transporter [Ramaria rubella]
MAVNSPMNSILSKVEAETTCSKSLDVNEKDLTVIEDVYVQVDTNKTNLQHEEISLDPTYPEEGPLKWPSWRKNTLLFIVAIHTMQAPFSAAITIPAFMDLSREFGVDLNTATYLTSAPIVFLAIMPSIWAPFSARIGRRPIYLISAIVSAACSLAGSFCHSYATLMITRIIQGIFLAPLLSIGVCSIREMFFAYERGQKIGFWALMVTIGAPTGPVVVGFLVQDKGWRAAFVLLAALHFGIFVAHLFLGPETLFIDRGNDTANVKPSRVRDHWYHVNFPIYDRTPIRKMEFIHPFLMAVRPVVMLAAMAYAVVFTYTNILVTTFVPQIFGKKFNLSPGQIGLQMLAQLTGAILGELLAGPGSDAFVNRRAKRTGLRVPEYRLLLAYPGFMLSIVGLIVWGVQLQNATPEVWNITPDVGSAIAIFGQQVVATVCTTYAVESYLPEAASVSAFMSFLRQFFGFLAPFYVGHAITNLGTAKVAGLFSSIMGIAMLMVIACNIWGPQWRKA